ncbi:strictosidine-o-beta-d-glucosidase [Phtheirospermum japonicum]|uniref:Strictosidine-o-beta-d-glucosidase n=1 Tax=Phtheirospermum japonicum TaxID=374723 RepID=A0A830CM66_9LAMI|nr:strictosidine-o-beta-d-glucosidase [Phtheirospermum japonicum]
MKNMGFDAYRFSISWSRILPGGKLSLGVNQEGVDYYNDLINTIIDNGMKPYVTLFHWDLPYLLEKEYGGFLSHKIIDDFRDFAELCFWEFGDRVKHWITINEAWTYCAHGYASRYFPPGHGKLVSPPKLKDPEKAKEAYTAARNILLSHAAAVQSYRHRFQKLQKGKIGMTNNIHWFEPFHDTDEDRRAARRAFDFMIGWFMEPVLTGQYPQNMIDFVPREYLKLFTTKESELLRGSVDFLGVNYYTTWYATHDPNPDADEGYNKDQKVKFKFVKNGVPIGESVRYSTCFL